MQPLRTFWDAADGWTVETPMALTPSQVAAVVQWVRRMQGPRVFAMRGDKHEQASAALAALSPATLKQRVVARTGAERVLYAKD